MKRIVAFAASHLSASSKPYRRICTAAWLLFVFSTSVGSANAQSKDRDNPTRLTSNVIAGTIGPDNYGASYYYTFVAGPGEVGITLTVEAGRTSNQVQFDLSDENEIRIASEYAGTYGGKTKQAIARVNVTRRQPVLLHVSLRNNSGPGNYRMHISGTVEVSQNTPHHAIDADVEAAIRTLNPKCLPKAGMLRVKMKDGSMREIDLSEAEEITIVP